MIALNQPTLMRFVNEAEACEDWFGAKPDMVHPLPRMIWFIARVTDTPIPEWLRSAPRLDLMPRFKREVIGCRRPLVGMSLMDIAKRVQWVVENQTGVWSLETRKGTRTRAIIFADDRDAVHYTLRFGRHCLTTV